MSKTMTMFHVKRQLATMQYIHTDYGNIAIASNLPLQADLERVLLKHLKKEVDSAYERGETVDWLVQAYKDKTGKELTGNESGDSLNGEVVLDNPRPSGGDKKRANVKPPTKKPEA